MNVKFVAPQSNGAMPAQQQSRVVHGAAVDMQARQGLAALQQEIARFHGSIVGALNKISTDMAALGAAVQELDRRTRSGGSTVTQQQAQQGEVVEAAQPRQIANAQPGDAERLPPEMYEGDERDE